MTNSNAYKAPKIIIKDKEYADNRIGAKPKYKIVESPMNQRNQILDEYSTDFDKRNQSSPKETNEEEQMWLYSDDKEKTEDPKQANKIRNNLKKKSTDGKNKVFNSNDIKKYKLNNRMISNDNTSFNWNPQCNFGYTDLFNKNQKEAFRKKTGFTTPVESTKKRNNTAKTAYKYSLGDTHSFNMFRGTSRINSTFRPGKKLEQKQNKMLIEMNNPKNPYSNHWTNKMLEKRYNMELRSNGFLNGIPLIQLNHKHNLISKVCHHIITIITIIIYYR